MLPIPLPVIDRSSIVKIKRSAISRPRSGCTLPTCSPRVEEVLLCERKALKWFCVFCRSFAAALRSLPPYVRCRPPATHSPVHAVKECPTVSSRWLAPHLTCRGGDLRKSASGNKQHGLKRGERAWNSTRGVLAIPADSCKFFACLYEHNFEGLATNTSEVRKVLKSLHLYSLGR
eukprot:85729-Prorocentrum_minimum.AAC.2